MARGVIQEIDFSALLGGTEELLLFSTTRHIRATEIGYYITDPAITGGTTFSVDIGYDGGTEIVNASAQTTPTTKLTKKKLVGPVDIPANSNVVVTVYSSNRTGGKIQFYFETDNDY